jgi:ATP-binding cassette, subfamily B, bacterial
LAAHDLIGINSYDLRVALYAHLQRLPLRFFIHTKTGELMSRLNNDVVGAQNAISTTIVQPSPICCKS